MRGLFILKIWTLVSLVVLNLSPAQESPETSFIIPLPQQRSTSHVNHLSNMTRDAMIYMITAFINPFEGSLRIIENPPNEGKDWGIIPVSAIAPDTLGSFRKASQKDSPLAAFQIFKNLLKTRAYLQGRSWYHSRFPVPETLIELEKHYNFSRWEQTVIEISLVKGAKRVIFRSPKHFPKISIAQTQIASSQTIRETELIIAREDLSNQFDFYAYDLKGNLSQTSLFHTQKGKDVSAAVPYTCLTCHYNSERGVFQTSPNSYFFKRVH